MLDLFVVPSSTTIINNISQISNPWFLEFLPFVYITLGVFVAGLLVVWFIRLFKNGFSNFTETMDQKIHTRPGTYEEKKYPWHSGPDY